MSYFRNSAVSGVIFKILVGQIFAGQIITGLLAEAAGAATLRARPAQTGSVTSPATSNQQTLGRPELSAAQSADATAKNTEDKGEEIAVDQIHDRYWAQGRDVEVGVVQNRIYSKRKKFELAVTGAKLNGDPFLTTNTLGGSLGYHFSEYLSLHALGWKAFVSNSSALTELISQLGTTTNTNPVNSFFAGELRASVLYGKLSLLGKLILYFDANLSAGAGSISTSSGRDFAYFFGIGQQIHVSHLFSINIDYRFLLYNETIPAAFATQNIPVGGAVGTRSNLSGLTTLSFSIFLDLFS